MLDLDKIKLDLKQRLSERRYKHSVLVAEEASKLARHYNVNESNAYLAGLLHDVAKEFSIEENQQWVEKYRLSSDLLSDKNLDTSHAKIGALVARELYGVNECISQAISYHTVGNIEMNMLDKIIFIADKIEGKRNQVESLRELAYQDIDEALIWYLQETKIRLKKDGKLFDEDSENLLKYLLFRKKD